MTATRRLHFGNKPALPARRLAADSFHSRVSVLRAFETLDDRTKLFVPGGFELLQSLRFAGYVREASGEAASAFGGEHLPSEQAVDVFQAFVSAAALQKLFQDRV